MTVSSTYGALGQHSDLLARHAEIGARAHHPRGGHVPITEAEVRLTPLHRWQRMVAMFGENVALAARGDALSYADLNAQANRLAHAILARDLPPEVPVALLLTLEWDLPIAILAVWKAGHPYVWLEPTQPFARIQFMAAESTASIVVTTREYAESAHQIWPSKDAVLVMDALDTAVDDAGVATLDPPNTLVGSSTAYLMYTSGSTGEPKATVELHRNLMYMLLERGNPLHFSPHDRSAMLVLGGGAYTIMSAFMYGGCLLPFSAKDEGLTRLTQWIVEQRVTVLIGSALVREWLLMLDGSEQSFALRICILGAGPTYREHVEAFQRHLPATCVLANFYSATEMRSIAFLLLDHASVITTRLLPVGFGPDWVEIEIWDNTGNVLPVGETGEIVVLTPYAAVGYWHAPALTAAKFGVDSQGRRFCRMGDLGKVDAQGCLWVLGRRDGQLKIRDNRVETAEVEVALLELPHVQDVAVVHLGEVDDVRALVGFVVADTHVSGEALRKQLADLLPEYMLPATIIVQDELPRNRNGKIARPLLRQMALALMEAIGEAQPEQAKATHSMHLDAPEPELRGSSKSQSSHPIQMLQRWLKR